MSLAESAAWPPPPPKIIRCRPSAAAGILLLLLLSPPLPPPPKQCAAAACRDLRDRAQPPAVHASSGCILSLLVASDRFLLRYIIALSSAPNCVLLRRIASSCNDLHCICCAQTRQFRTACQNTTGQSKRVPPPSRPQLPQPPLPQQQQQEQQQQQQPAQPSPKRMRACVGRGGVLCVCVCVWARGLLDAEGPTRRKSSAAGDRPPPHSLKICFRRRRAANHRGRIPVGSGDSKAESADLVRRLGDLIRVRTRSEI